MRDEIGWICAIVTIGVAVEGWTMFPMSTRRMPRRCAKR